MKPATIAVLVLTVLDPLRVALDAHLGLERVLGFGAPGVALLLARGAVAAIGIAAGLLLLRGNADGWRLARAWALLALLVTMITFATPYFPSNRTPAGKRAALLAWTIGYGVAVLVAHRAVRRDAAAAAGR